MLVDIPLAKASHMSKPRVDMWKVITQDLNIGRGASLGATMDWNCTIGSPAGPHCRLELASLHNRMSQFLMTDLYLYTHSVGFTSLENPNPSPLQF